MPWNGMEWKMVWNGRRFLVWNMEDAQNGMEDLKNGMEDRLPYSILTTYIKTYNKLQSNSIRYQYEYIVSMVISQPMITVYPCIANNRTTRCAQ